MYGPAKSSHRYGMDVWDGGTVNLLCPKTGDVNPGHVYSSTPTMHIHQISIDLVQ